VQTGLVMMSRAVIFCSNIGGALFTAVRDS